MYKRVLLVCIVHFLCGYSYQFDLDNERAKYRYKVEKWLNSVDGDLSEFNALAAHLTWQLSTQPDEKSSVQAKELSVARNKWKNKVCQSNVKREWLTKEQKRKHYLLCRGPKFSDDIVVEYLDTLARLSQEYNSEICFPGHDEHFLEKYNEIFGGISDVPRPGDCFYGEPDLERLMKRNDLSTNQLKWIWETWYDFIGPRIKKMYPVAVKLQNQAAKLNGYDDMGEVWREELEMPQLETQVEYLYNEMKPLYEALHAVLRHKLYLKYGDAEIDLKGPLPIHLLGNMWGQDWSSLLHLFVPSGEMINFNKKLADRNYTVKEMVLEAEDFYVSLGLPRMTEKFWKYSIFEETKNATVCHGTAANLYDKGDFRMMMCGKIDMYDFYVIHHEMGHIEYYMAYEQQPSIFQDGANTAIHESIGDAIMHGVMTPQHLNRIGLLSDQQLLDKNIEIILLLYQALSKIPEIPFSLLIDKYRWDIFKGKIQEEEYNAVYWQLNRRYRGVVPPQNRSELFFDAGAKFHIPDNTPYIRYFLSSIIQMDIFKSLCEYALYGRNSVNKEEEEALPIHRCDIYGSKKNGRLLRSMMEKGSSIHWKKALEMLTGNPQITTKPFLQYYAPVYDWLQAYIKENNVYVGW